MRQLLMMLLGEDGRRKLENQTKPNDQVFAEYYDLIGNTHTPKTLYEAKRLLQLFRRFIGQFPPGVPLALQFLTRYQELRPTTRQRYQFVLSAFFKWYSGEKLPIKVRTPKMLPQYVPGEDIDRIIERMKQKQSHKQSLKRDILLIETLKMTGLRRSEAANLKVGDLLLDGPEPVLVVRAGKGNKDRTVSLNSYIRERLAGFVKEKQPAESVFGLAPKSISQKIRQWAVKAGVPHVHAHSMRHYVGTELFRRGANPRAIQSALGHESLEVTMRYAAVTGRDTHAAMELLEPARNGGVDSESAKGTEAGPAGKETAQPPPDTGQETLEDASAAAVRVVEQTIELAPGTRKRFDLDLCADTIYVESLRVVSVEGVEFRVAVYDSWRRFHPRKDRHGEALEQDLVIGPLKRENTLTRVYYKPKRPEVYHDKDGAKQLHGDIAFLRAPIDFSKMAELSEDAYTKWQLKPLPFTITLLYRCA